MKFLRMFTLLTCIALVASASAMECECGGSVAKEETKRTIDGNSYRITAFSREYHDKKLGELLDVRRVKNRKTGKVRYVGKIDYLRLNKKTREFEHIREGVLFLDNRVDMKKKLKSLYKKLEKECSEQNK